MGALSETFIEISDESNGFLFSEPGYLKFTPDSKALIAASCEGFIYKFDYKSSSNEITNITECCSKTFPFTERITKISVSNNCDVAMASESNELVRLFKMREDGTLGECKLVTKSSGFTYALAINPSGTILCCSGADNNIKIVSIKDDNEFPVLNQIPSTHFVKSIAFSENGKLLAFLQVDGLLKIFKIVENNPAPQLIKTLSGFRADMKANFQLSWKENVLAVLYGGEYLRVYEAENWTIKSEISIQKCLNFELISKEAAFLTFSTGEMAIYSIERNQIISTANYQGGDEKEFENCSIAICNENFASIFDPKRSDLFLIKIKINSNDLIKVEDKNMKLSKLSRNESSKSSKIKKTKKGLFAKEEESDTGSGHESDHESGQEDDSVNEYGSENDHNSDMEGSADENMGFESDNRQESELVRKLHPVIQPCCTPWRNHQHYLAYNNVGFITARRSLDQDKTVFNYDIEFMDRSAHQPIRFSNEISFKAASLSEKGAIFVSDGAGAGLHYVPFDSPTETWNVPLSLGTEPILNSKGILNIYSLSGLLQSSSTCPGRPISLVCPEEKGIIYLFTEDSEGVLCFKLNSRNGGAIGIPSRVLLGSESTLTWCGIGFSGVLGAFDSNGKLLILLTRETERWTVILDTSHNLADKYEQAWPVYFDVNTLSGIVCKMIDNFPDPYPGPHVIDFNFKIPELETDETYEEIVRTNWILNETGSNGLTEREKKKLLASSDRNLLELAQLSIRSNRIDRLSDLSRWASNEKTIELLVQLANHHKLAGVVEEMERIKIELFSQNREVTTIGNGNLSSTLGNLSSAVGNLSSTPLAFSASSTVSKLSQSFEVVSSTMNISTSKLLLPDQVCKESPSGILANLTPMKSVSGVNIASSPSELAAPSPSNPFAKENSNNLEGGGNAMLDYISAMMSLNNSGSGKFKRKGEEFGGVSKKGNKNE